jgi:hypothetical protein
MCYTIGAQTGEQVYDKKRQPTNYKNACMSADQPPIFFLFVQTGLMFEGYKEIMS